MPDTLASGGFPDSLLIGHSVQGQPLSLFRLGKTSLPRILFLGGIHGDEPQSAAFADSLIRFLKQTAVEIFGWEVFVLPVLNPDGLAAKTRQNAHGVDLNRNFPSADFEPKSPGDRQYGGSNPLSEPESQAFSELMDKLNPALLVVLHEPLNCVNYDGPASDLAAKLARDLDLPLQEDIGYPTPGSLGSHYGRERGFPIITLEFPGRMDAWSRFGLALLQSLGIFSRP